MESEATVKGETTVQNPEPQQENISCSLDGLFPYGPVAVDKSALTNLYFYVL